LSGPISDSLPYFAALSAAVAGSLHCAGMCGPLRLLCNNVSGARWKYQAGRGLAYALLGTIAGGVGFVLPLWALLTLVLIGGAGALLKLPSLPYWASLRKSLLRIGSTSPFLLGLSSGLLPCGLLHGWLVAAAATGRPEQGAILLSLLWVGSLPALETTPFVLGKPIGKLNRRFPRAVKLSLLAVALLPLALRLSIKADASLSVDSPHCHTSATPPLKPKLE